MPKLNVEVTEATVHVRHGCSDVVWFDTDLAEPTRGDTYQFRTRLPEGTGEQWVKTTLGVTPNVIDLDAERQLETQNQQNAHEREALSWLRDQVAEKL